MAPRRGLPSICSGLKTRKDWFYVTVMTRLVFDSIEISLFVALGMCRFDPGPIRFDLGVIHLDQEVFHLDPGVYRSDPVMCR